MGKKPSASAAAAAAAADHDSTVASAKAAELLAAAADCDDIHGHSMFFDALVQLIPPRFYLSADDDVRPYYQGISKAAKAAMKAQSRANIKAARRARLDPAGPPSSTLDLLKKSVADQEAEEKKEEEEDKSQDESQESDDEATSEGGDDDQDNEEGDEEEEEEEEEEAEDEKEEMQMAPAAVVSEDRSVTYEELRERLHRRITELRGNRCTRPEFLNKPEKEKGKKAKGAKLKGKDEGTKRKREDDTEGKDGKKHNKEGEEKASDIMYGNALVDPKEARRRKKMRVKNKKKELEQAKRMQRANEDPKKATKLAWDVATRRATGEKVHDNPKLIKESMKKDKKRQQKHAEEWKDRQRTVDIKKKQKQNKRKENIQGRAEEKKARKIEKREKKLMRPGFEGRKEGYVNE